MADEKLPDYHRLKVAPRVRALIRLLGLKKQAEAADLMGYDDRAACSAVLMGRYSPNDQAVLRLWNATQVSADWIVFGRPSGLAQVKPEDRVRILSLERAEAAALQRGKRLFRPELRSGRKNSVGGATDDDE